MTRDDAVILIADPLKYGVGTIKGLTPRGWLWVTWPSGHFDSYAPNQLEHATVWEDRVLSTTA